MQDNERDDKGWFATCFSQLRLCLLSCQSGTEASVFVARMESLVNLANYGDGAGWGFLGWGWGTNHTSEPQRKQIVKDRMRDS